MITLWHGFRGATRLFLDRHLNKRLVQTLVLSREKNFESREYINVLYCTVNLAIATQTYSFSFLLKVCINKNLFRIPWGF